MENRINHIIARVLSGESSSDDIFSLSEWLNENEKNRNEFRQIKNYWDADVAFKHSIAPICSADKLQQKINVQKKQTNRLRLWNITTPIAAAVCLLFIFSTTLFLYITNQLSTEHFYTLLTGEDTSSFTMTDGTIITLNRNSRLSYSNKYGKENRNVKLEGEAYFEVAKDVNKPFIVKMDEASITVLGTHFNVQANTKSDNITATLVEGSIRFESEKQNVVMTPNQQLTFSRSTNKIDIKEIETDTYTAWRNGLLKYKSIPFFQLIEDLQNIYSVKIQITDKRLTESSVTVSGTFEQKQSIEQILKVISHSLPIQWTKKNGIYQIRHQH